ncbi:MAG: pyruvate, phosphate dikinase [Symbiobacteriaceae bacterium]|nr:MAG: pyruvate, phosphate dikinase [Bacillota bacterium]
MTAVAAERARRWVYFFDEGSGADRMLLGGKGANLAEMTRIGLPVPPGFTITTEACKAYLATGGQFPPGLMEQVDEKLARLEEEIGRRFGDPRRPLLVSVRSGAPVSMPGMMDTILNLGLNDEAVRGLAEETGDARFAFDCYRRLIQMFGEVVLRVPASRFEHALEAARQRRGVRFDHELPAQELEGLVETYKEIVRKATGAEFPQDPRRQLELAVRAVFESWNNERAKVYRRIHKVPDDLGTAVNVQAMVFGNTGPDSGTGVMFTRNPSTGDNELYGEYLPNAQGEDVVAGIRTPEPIARLAEERPELYRQLREVAERLERHYRDMQDIEFTVDRGRLFVLQTRSGKRTAAAAVRIAHDMVREGLIDRRTALLRVDPEQVARLLHKHVDPNLNVEPLAQGLPASPGAAVGAIVFDPDEAERLGREGQAVILVRPETTPDDIHGIVAAQGVLTSRGGMTSHAAVVARGMGKPAVCGCEALRIDLEREECRVGDRVLRKGDRITIDGATGRVFAGEVPLVEPELSPEFRELLAWADEARRLRVMANADTPEDARRAREFGAEGIGLCRTEHMFMGPERVPAVQRMIMAETREEREAALAELETMQQADFEGILEAMAGLPVTIRLLDPPLHEFLPSLEELLVEVTRLELTGADPARLEERRELLRKVRALHEANPMLGHRGCRLGVTFPEVYEMQARAIFRATAKLRRRGVDARPEIMIPLVAHVRELAFLRERVEAVRRQVEEETGISLRVPIGTMIEVPRAALTAGEVASVAEFFSFGTNDLTQTTFGFSRDDAESKFLHHYLAEKILPENPFISLDEQGVGRLLRIAVEEGRRARPELKVGICGEHGGDPASIEFCHRIGLDYVSCSPFRVLIARLAAGRAAAAEGGEAEPRDV